MSEPSCRAVPGTVKSRPLILVSPRWSQKTPTAEAPERTAPEESVNDCFMDAIVAAGGLPLMMPLTRDRGLIDELVAMACGIALPGGQDVDPARFGGEQEGAYDPALLCPERDAFEFPLVERALAADKPLFATCRGTQLLNVVLGGTLCMDVPRRPTRPGMVAWKHDHALVKPVHEVEVVPGSLLSRAMGGALRAQVNSAHHCCVERLGEGAVLAAEATDGVPEAIEVPGKRFVLGVQWHPEYTWGAIGTDFNLWKAFVDAAGGVCP